MPSATGSTYTGWIVVACRQLLVDLHLERFGGHVEKQRIEIVVMAGQDDSGPIGFDQRAGRRQLSTKQRISL